MHYAMDMRVCHPVLMRQTTQSFSSSRVPCFYGENFEVSEFRENMMLTVGRLVGL